MKSTRECVGILAWSRGEGEDLNDYNLVAVCSGCPLQCCGPEFLVLSATSL